MSTRGRTAKPAHYSIPTTASDSLIILPRHRPPRDSAHIAPFLSQIGSQASLIRHICIAFPTFDDYRRVRARLHEAHIKIWNSGNALVLVYDLASSTLRSATAQGRQSRNSTAAANAAAPSLGGHRHHHSLSHSLSSASLGSSTGGCGGSTPVEQPFLAYEAKAVAEGSAKSS